MTRRIEDYRADLSAAEIEHALARHTRSVAALSYLHALPAFLHMRQLTEFIQARRVVAAAEPPLGGWLLVRALADPSITTVSPNVDTLYGAAYLLLDRQGPVVLTLPPIPDRYHSVAVMDAYFTTVDIIGTSTEGGAGGSYLIAPPGWSGQTPPGVARVVTATTPSVCLFQRIYLRGQAELPVLHALQDAITLTPLEGWLGREREFPPVNLEPYEIGAMRATTDPLQFFRYMSWYTEANPPPDRELVTLFRSAGVGPGSALPDDPALLSAILAGAEEAQATIDGLLCGRATRDGWTTPDTTAGTADADLARRAAVQLIQMGLLPAHEAVYLSGYADASGERLHGSKAYDVRFEAGGLPPHGDLGFWSLTMYDDRSLLVPNEIGRYVLRPDTAGLTAGDDGSLTLRLQHDRPAGIPAGNWLPAPSGGFTVALRIYLPDPEVLDGLWAPPAIRRVG